MDNYLAELHPRGYQLEMLRESIRRNIIVAMDTGSGKTFIHSLMDESSSILRISVELERDQANRIVWFLCHTVALCEQQLAVVQRHLPWAPSRILCGRDGVDAWTSQDIWNEALRNMKVVVCTYQVLLDALSHGFVRMSEISLIVFDEAHYCAKKHPACRIMTEFYHPSRANSLDTLPAILGLTASPITRDNKDSLQIIEQSLNAIAKTPKINRAELQNYTNRPIISVLFFAEHKSTKPSLLEHLTQIYLQMDIEEDPYVINLKMHNNLLYEKTIANRNTYCEGNVKRLLSLANKIFIEFGPWLAEQYIISCIHRNVKQFHSSATNAMNLSEEESRYLFKVLSPLDVPIPPPHEGRHSSKLLSLLELLDNEMTESFTAIVFVETRSATQLLASFLSAHTSMRGKLRIGTFVGSSQSLERKYKIGELTDSRNQEHTLKDIKSGALNLLICTTVCEEGIDISACNLVICFDPPKNIKSFIQRRGRARSPQSKFVLLYQEGDSGALDKWLELEKEMIELYMNDMRETRVYEGPDGEKSSRKDFTVPNTKAKLTLFNAVQHLHHFCDKLPHMEYTNLAPIFSFEEFGEDFSCEVMLPSTIHASVRTFSSSQTWKTSRLARMDAAFEAYIGLFKAGLVNEHLLPSHSPDAKIAGEYEKIASRDRLIEVHGQMDPWVPIAAKWQAPQSLTQYKIIAENSNGDLHSRMIMFTPCPLRLPTLSTISLHLDAETSLQVRISDPIEITANKTFIEEANLVTRMTFASVFGSKMEPDRTGFPLLFVPVGIENYTSWLQEVSGTYPASLLLARSEKTGIVRSVTHPGRRFCLQGIVSDAESPTGSLLSCTPLKARTNFLHPFSNSEAKPNTAAILLDPETCEIDRLPMTYASFARLVPSIMHRIEVELIAKELCNDIFSSVEFSGFEAVVPAISTPSTGEMVNYQRLEFLGDCILKILVSIYLVSNHPTWHEGHLSLHKDLIVSNARLAKAAEDVGIIPYILTTAFASNRWRPPYNDELLSRHETANRTMSTKVLADVVEALLGAIFLDGKFPNVLKALSILIPEISWQPVDLHVNHILQTAVSQYPSIPPTSQTSELEKILGYEFTHRQLLMEAITHPSHVSASPSINSYQRLEFLGDALLDYVVTNAIYGNKGHLPVPKMHLLRTATVNGSFLAFCALSTTISLPIAEIDSTLISLPNRADRFDQAQRRPSNITAASVVMKTKHLSLPLYLRFGPNASLASALASTRKRFEYLAPMISESLSSSSIYPWRLLAALNPEKVFSDLVESALAAVWIDSRGDFGVCEALLRKLGILGWLENALQRQVKVWHPKEEIGICAGEQKVRYRVWKDNQEQDLLEPERDVLAEGERRRIHPDGILPSLKPHEEVEEESEVLELGKGRWRCRVYVGETEVAAVQGWNKIEVETAAAEEAVKILKAGKAVDQETIEIPGGLGQDDRCKSGTSGDTDKRSKDVDAAVMIAMKRKAESDIPCSEVRNIPRI